MKILIALIFLPFLLISVGNAKELTLVWSDEFNHEGPLPGRPDSNKWNYGLGIEPGAFNDKKECVEIMFKNDKVISIRPYQEEITFENEKE